VRPPVEEAAAAAGRVLLAAVFIHGGQRTLADPAPREQAAARLLGRARAAAPWLPPDAALVKANAAVHVAAGLALATGICQRPAALVLAVSLVPVTAAGHPFWEPGDGREAHLIQAVKNAGILGGLVLLAASARR